VTKPRDTRPTLAFQGIDKNLRTAARSATQRVSISIRVVFVNLTSRRAAARTSPLCALLAGALCSFFPHQFLIVLGTLVCILDSAAGTLISPPRPERSRATRSFCRWPRPLRFSGENSSFLRCLRLLGLDAAGDSIKDGQLRLLNGRDGIVDGDSCLPR